MSSNPESSNFSRDNSQDNNDDDFVEDQDHEENHLQNDNDERTQRLQNHFYDEAVEISEEVSEIPSDLDQYEEQTGRQERDNSSFPQQRPISKAESKPFERKPSDNDAQRIVGQYDPSNYANLDVSAEVQDLFQYITRFRSKNIELGTKLKPFIPSYIPAVGEADGFLKPSRPDNKQESLGLEVIDEPCLNQTKETGRVYWNWRRLSRPINRVVDFIEDAHKNPKEIDKWIRDVSSIQRQAPSVIYSNSFPDILSLSQIWPVEFEDALKEVGLPTEDIEMSLVEYAKLCCALVDIPVHQGDNPKSIMESLHVYFTLYEELSFTGCKLYKYSDT